MQGLLIAFCGLDGSGKTTQLRLLAGWLEAQGQRVLCTAQPTPAYRTDPRVRGYLDSGDPVDMRTLALLSAADRRWHMTSVVDPARAQGTHVLTDRYVYSAYAYFAARGLDVDYVRAVNEPLTAPGLTVFLDAAPALAMERVAARDGALAKYEERRLDALTAIRTAFLQVLPPNALVLDATTPPDGLHQAIAARVVPLLAAATDRPLVPEVVR